MPTNLPSKVPLFPPKVMVTLSPSRASATIPVMFTITPALASSALMLLSSPTFPMVILGVVISVMTW
ncbi:hypothetical protein BWP33_05670 [Simonsiella muelleri ATCC 29453]|nr:hypothetical protein BWP33_05670 [Simonsiella muelleri ATCC 29453]